MGDWGHPDVQPQLQKENCGQRPGRADFCEVFIDSCWIVMRVGHFSLLSCRNWRRRARASRNEANFLREPDYPASRSELNLLTLDGRVQN